jgi:hypothetical protein
MGQQANSGRRATLDDKKRRQAGRKQNEPEVRQIGNREAPPGAGGASGKQGHANRKSPSAPMRP